MVNFSTPPGLEGLLDLDRQGVDIRPTLLRVLTDQYLQSHKHTPEEERHYTELALRLLDETDIPTRAAVANRLAPHACAPRAIILQLARDVLEIAEPVLLHSPCLTPADCETIVSERGVCYAEIIARRGKRATPPPAAEPAPKTRPSPVARALPAEMPRVETPAGAAQTGETEVGTNAQELCELFFAAGSSERRLILLNLEFAAWPAVEPPVAMQRADVWRLETAALRHSTATVMRELEQALGISYRQARRIVEDELGEPIVAAAKAMKLPADVLQRILLFMNPRVGQSVDRVYELAQLYSEISVDAARRLVTILRGSESAEHKVTDTRALYAAAETARRALGEVGRAPAPKRDTLHVAPATQDREFLNSALNSATPLRRR